MRSSSLFILIVITSILFPSTTYGSDSEESVKPTNQAKGSSQRESLGLDPTEVIGRIEFNYTYLEKESGTERNNGVLVIEKDINKKTVVGIELPLVSAKPVEGSSQIGLGDIELSYKYAYAKDGNFSTSFGGFLSLDSATDDELGDGENEIRVGMLNAWKKGDWMIASITSLGFSENKENNSAVISPLFVYQPLDKFYSYISLGTPFKVLTQSGDESILSFFRIGKVMPNKDIYYFGTQATISGENDDDFVLSLGYRRLF